jgi:signal transduction histidine kinase
MQERYSSQVFCDSQASADRRRLAASALVIICCILFNDCRSQPTNAGPSIEFTRLPLADPGGTPKLDTIEGRVIGAHPEQKIVLFARSGAWWVQPYADQPFTTIQPDSTWKSLTQLGTEYAALLVEPEYHPPSSTNVLPGEGEGIAAVVIAKGEPRFWQTWWFQLSCGLVCAFAILALYRYRLNQMTRQLNMRFEERLAERMRIAQELHDTLLQGFISASMQLHVAVDNLPADSPSKPPLSRVLQLMGQVIEEGRNAVRGLRSADNKSNDLEQAFSRIQQELGLQEQIGFRIIVEGRPQSLHPIIRDEVYRIGREALVNAFRHSRAKHVEVELEYAGHLRILVRDDGRGIDAQVLKSGRDGHWGLSGMRERAEGIGARLNVRSRAASGTEVELSVPGHIAFQFPSSKNKSSDWRDQKREI